MARDGYVERSRAELERESREGAEREADMRAEIQRLEKDLADARAERENCDHDVATCTSGMRVALDRATRELVAAEADRDRWAARVKELEARISLAHAALDGRP